MAGFLKLPFKDEEDEMTGREQNSTFENQARIDTAQRLRDHISPPSSPRVASGHMRPSFPLFYEGHSRSNILVDPQSRSNPQALYEDSIFSPREELFIEPTRYQFKLKNHPKAGYNL